MNKLDELITIEDAIKVLCKKTCCPGPICPDGYCKEMWEAFEGVKRYGSTKDLVTCYGYNTRELLLFAEACRKQGIDERDLKDFMHNVEAIIDLVRQELRESVARAVGDFMGKEELRDEQRDEET